MDFKNGGYLFEPCNVMKNELHDFFFSEHYRFSQTIFFYFPFSIPLNFRNEFQIHSFRCSFCEMIY